MDDTFSHDLIRTLTERFGLAGFRRGQREILDSVLSRRDAMAVMPTGGGKSLCYQLPAVMREGLVVVVSPLIALMRDQTSQLRRLGIPAGCLYSGQDLDEKKRVFADAGREKHFLLYLSPERVQKPGFAQWIRTQPVTLFAIDEAHCVSQWGPDFRPDYYKLALLRELRADVPILALTATATPLVLADVSKTLGLRSPDRHVYGFYRPNLYYQVETSDDPGSKHRMVRAALSGVSEGRAIVYCGTRSQCEEIVNDFSGEFPGLGYYHAGLDPETRSRTQRDFEEGRIRFLAATNAFGMGIDIPDIRLVVHYQMPANVESYYQEIGRAGRDGKPSTCVLLYSKKDKGLQGYFIRTSGADKETLDRRWRALDAITLFAEGGECRHAGILTYFRDTQRLSRCGHCDICAPDSDRRIVSPSSPLFATPVSRRRRARAEDDGAPLSVEAKLRYEVLEEWRKEYARENDIPAFLVFSNKTLRDLAVKAPSTLADLEDVYGFGEKKIEHLGELVLDKIAEATP